jgi:hypothetical protein
MMNILRKNYEAEKLRNSSSTKQRCTEDEQQILAKIRSYTRAESNLQHIFLVTQNFIILSDRDDSDLGRN